MKKKAILTRVPEHAYSNNERIIYLDPETYEEIPPQAYGNYELPQP